MPWHIERREGRYCVIKDDDDENEGCHDSREKAQAQMRALYASEPNTRAALKAKTINDLPDSAFAYIEPGGKKDEQGKTVPRSKRHFPIHDAAHVRNALARAPQSPFGAKAMPKIKAAARRFGIKVSDDDRSAPTTEILNRAAVVSDVDKRQYLIDVLAVPWDEPAQIFWRGDIWTEVFHRGAFDGVEERAGRIRVNREHTKGATVGKIIALDPHDDAGLKSQVKIAKSPAGDEIMALADEDMISVSIGYRANKPSDVQLDKRAKRRDVYGAFLDHLSFVEDPTWDRAQVLSVREGPNGLAVAEGPLPQTPALDAILQDDVIGWAASYPYRKE